MVKQGKLPVIPVSCNAAGMHSQMPYGRAVPQFLKQAAGRILNLSGKIGGRFQHSLMRRIAQVIKTNSHGCHHRFPHVNIVFAGGYGFGKDNAVPFGSVSANCLRPGAGSCTTLPMTKKRCSHQYEKSLFHSCRHIPFCSGSFPQASSEKQTDKSIPPLSVFSSVLSMTALLYQNICL